MRLDNRRASLLLANLPTHPASLPVRLLTAVERLLSALSRPTLTDRSLAYGYGCRYLPRWVPVNPVDPAPARHTSADILVRFGVDHPRDVDKNVRDPVTEVVCAGRTG